MSQHSPRKNEERQRRGEDDWILGAGLIEKASEHTARSPRADEPSGSARRDGNRALPQEEAPDVAAVRPERQPDTHVVSSASANDVPYYTLRQSGPDRESADESGVEVEIRSGDALLYLGGKRTAPEGVEGLYPSFDITPAELVTAIVTDRGVFEAAKISAYVEAAPFVTGEIL